MTARDDYPTQLTGNVLDSYMAAYDAMCVEIDQLRADVELLTAAVETGNEALQIATQFIDRHIP